RVRPCPARAVRKETTVAQHTLPQYDTLQPETREAIGTVLHNLRVNAGEAGKALILTEVAARSGICIGTLSQAENGIRLTWRTIEGHVKACSRTKAKMNAALKAITSLIDTDTARAGSGAAGHTVEEQAGSAIAKEAVKKQACEYWDRRPALRMPPDVKSFEDGVLCLSALSDRSSVSLRSLANIMTTTTGCKISHSTLAQVFNGNAPLTPMRLRSLLIAHHVPYKSWASWSDFFRKHDPNRRGKEYWALSPDPETLSVQRKHFGERLMQAVGEDVIINQYAMLAGTDSATINQIFNGEDVAYKVISRALVAARRYGVSQDTLRKLTKLAAPLQFTTTA
ncbi:hypothetical protein, partial [Streptomyces sp. SAS_260]|uniref:hypothetical protein n=1 Tax=Streptomyces sp. SAS_260 TaxID=3412751 RepID=UPI00403CBC83